MPKQDNLRRSVYIDHGATTPVDPRVVEAMAPYWGMEYGNPSSHHSAGHSARRAVERARETLATCLNTPADSIVFTGCGSESNNLALRGAMLAAKEAGRGQHLITGAIEHGAVLATALQLRDHFGFDLTVVPVDETGRVSPDDVTAAIRPDTVLISIMAANNEIGSIQPWREIGELARAHDILYHTDAVQLAAARQWDLLGEPVDMMTLAPHKFYGPKGVGVLIVREGISLLPTQTGGGHEHGLRAGTLNVPLIVGAAEAYRLAMEEMSDRLDHLVPLRDALIAGVTAIDDEQVRLTGHPAERLPHHASFAFQHLSGNDLLMHLDMAGIAASSGSACSSGDPKPSAVLQAIGLEPTWTRGGLRLTLGQQNSADDIRYVVDTLASVTARLNSLAPLTVA